ncbi:MULTISPECIES: PQQ-dependent dehydrogenase, methanol/ethanol family [Sphingobium]|uniref:PQQ-dependent dehydrogenase, methanol/ethanol family n=1 Tax=Sphingobium TaxID=165695 RepID=UPI001803DE95|nr:MULTISPECIES: PQQ-dependent dehydrogenase, methanol/ethanol family [Sphingobium]MCW2362478.1 quinohemoprotein ethanol dehydrogenase [Sphingobium sp. B10D3B]MCW2400842.1 quinohemoprotein ethanol dehydrogenase [Sphingobium sp. B10D7B]MCW2407821.1 quinohemoprotein ethanol dehydrogenase [Sphingobium xanthum]
MMAMWRRPAGAVGIAVLVLGALMVAFMAQLQASGRAEVDSARMAAQATDGTDWLHDGRTYSAQRYSPLDQINAQNVSQLGIAWYDDLDTFRGVEATPLYADGVLYNTLPWNITIAYDARTGKRLWSYDPQVQREFGRYACCEPVARGLALWKGKVIIATLDGRVIALNAADGKPVWSVQSTPKDMPYTITGSPRVFDGKVVVGNSGGDMGIRGFVAAYDADTGKEAWKFYLTPGDPAKGPDGAASDNVMEMIRKTWSGDYWKLGGGANAWDSIGYDPALKLVYIGTGNGSPLSWHYRSNGKGDNLFICSIVAVNVETGKYAWHYQMVPEEDWDYTCTQSIVTADLKIGGRDRKVLMQAPKNGYFYVLDRATGAFISAGQIAPANWTLGIDPKTGRPKMNPDAHYGQDPFLVKPGPGGAHNWFPMAYSPRTKLAYFPLYESGMVLALDPDFQPKPFRSNAGWGGYTGEAAKKRGELMKEAVAMDKAYLLAWDPVKQKEAWKIPLPRHGNGGVMVTGSDLVFEGTTRQTFAAFDARNGKLLWEMPVQSAPVAGPITYTLDGVQYVAVNAGWGGGAAMVERGQGIEMPRAPARLIVFKLGGTAQLPALQPAAKAPEPPPLRASEAQVARGAQLFAETCAVCHGQQAIGGVKDLRMMTRETHAKFNDIVLKGLYADKGMASFADLISAEDAEAIHGYLIARANEDWGGVSDGKGPH